MSEPTTLLIDSDILAFQHSAKGEKKIDWDNDGSDVSVHAEDIEDILPRVDAELRELKADLEADELIICLSCSRVDNFRRTVLPTYKANRDGSVPPVHLSLVKEYVAREYPSFQRPTLEADDIMGILSTHPTRVPGKKIIVSEDKDMKTIPGWLYNPRHDIKARNIPLIEANWWHMYQTIVGDTTDHYKGAPGYGDVAARALLDDTPEPAYWWTKVVSLFQMALQRQINRGAKKAKQDDPPVVTYEQAEAEALVQARVARILRHTDYDFKKKEVKLWTPNAA